jgi:hypothetical protein
MGRTGDDYGFAEKWGEKAALALGLLAGVCFFAYYYHEGLTVAHYDAKAHLMVARRVFDSSAPGYDQLGAHWLPLAHLLYLPLVALESQYRSGFLPALLSVVSFGISCWMTYRIAYRAAGSASAALLSAVVVVANSNLLYLQSCPLTEPLFLVFMLLAIDGFWNWRDYGSSSVPWLPAGWASLSALCRYEGWYIIAGIAALILWDMMSRRIRLKRAASSLAAYLALFLLPLLLHFGYLYARVHDSFLLRVAQGNPAPLETYKRPLLSIAYHLGELGQAGSVLVLVAAAAGFVVFFRDTQKLQSRLPLLLLWLPSLINLSALYWGMVYRVRYSCILIPAMAVFSGLAMSYMTSARRLMVVLSIVSLALPWLPWLFPHEWRFHFLYPGPGLLLLPVAACFLFMASRHDKFCRPCAAVLLVLGMQVPVLMGEFRPVLEEALEHRYLEGERNRILSYLGQNYDGSKILVDSLKQAPLIYDSGIRLRNFIWDEGDKTLWRRAMEAPSQMAGWLCAIKGDEIWNRLNVDPHWASEYALVSHSENFALYRLRRRGQ